MTDARTTARRGGWSLTLPLLFAFLALVPPHACAQDARGGTTGAKADLGCRSRERREGIVLAKFKEGVSVDAIARGLKSIGAERVDRLSLLEVDVLRVSAGAPEEDWAEKIVASGLVEWAEPDYLAQPSVTPNDPYFSYQWHHATIKSPAAWDSTTGSATIIIGVVDSGVSASHPDLAGKVLPGWNTVSKNTDSSDIAGHGTAVAGSCAAGGHNHVGGAGVSWHSKILPVRVSNSSGGSAYSSAISDGIAWAATHGAKVINVSMGPLYGSIFDTAAKFAESKDAIVLVSSGNSGTEYPTWPDYPSIVYVGATGTSDTKTSFSSYGTYVDCTAPGVSIVTTSKSGGYMYFGGTSAAAPVAAGVAALIRAAAPSLKVGEVKSILLTTCDDKGAAGEDVMYGWGRVNALKAVTAALAAVGGSSGGGSSSGGSPGSGTPAPPPDTTPPSKPLITSVANLGTGGTLKITWKANPEPDVAHYVITRYQDKSGYTTLGTVPVGTTTYTDTGLVNGLDYWYFVRAVDTSGNKSAWSDYKGAIPSGP